MNESFVLAPDTWVWMFCEHVADCLVVVVIVLIEPVYKAAIVVFLALTIVDTIFFGLNYNDPLKDLPVDFNILKIVIFAFAMYNEKYPLWKN